MIIETLKLEPRETIPRELKSGTLYYSEKYKVAIHLCPCGCGHQVVTPTNKGEWNLTHAYCGKPTLHPSCLNKWCGSHYFVRDGQIIWC